MNADNAQIRFAHYSDTHLGREQYHEAVTATGRNQRGVDLVKSFHNVSVDIAARSDIPLALHAGDVCDTPNSPIAYMIAAKKEINYVAGPLEDGSPYLRQHVIIAGNHDMPRSPQDPCYLALFRGAPGVHIVTNGYKIIDFDKEIAEGTAHPSLKDVLIHCIPHDDLKTLEWYTVQPIEGKRNILMTHGVAEGSALYIQARGREYPIPADVMSREWDYVALGHWHKRGPVFLSGDTESTKSRIWYSGSPDNCNFSDARDDNGKGYLIVDLGETQKEMPKIEEITLPIRKMVTLPPVDATDLSPEEIGEALVKRVEEADEEGILQGSVIRQRVTNARQELWALVDRRPAKAAAEAALAYDCRPLFTSADDGDAAIADLPDADQNQSDYEKILREKATELLAERLRQPALSKATNLLNQHLAEPIIDDEK